MIKGVTRFTIFFALGGLACASAALGYSAWSSWSQFRTSVVPPPGNVRGEAVAAATAFIIVAMVWGVVGPRLRPLRSVEAAWPGLWRSWGPVACAAATAALAVSALCLPLFLLSRELVVRLVGATAIVSASVQLAARSSSAAGQTADAGLFRRHVATAGALATVASVHYLWLRSWPSSVLLVLFLGGIVPLASFVRFIIEAAKSSPLETAKSGLQVLQAAGLFFAALGLLLNYHQSIQKRFNEVKPLFYREPSDRGGMALHNAGGWVMFLGIANRAYLERRRVPPPDEPLDRTPFCEAVRFSETPARYTPLANGGSATFRVDLASAAGELARSAARGCRTSRECACSVLMTWTDADGDFYEQELRISLSTLGLDLQVPRFKRPPATWISTVLAPFQVGEVESGWLPERSDAFDTLNFCAHPVVTGAGGAGDPCPDYR